MDEILENPEQYGYDFIELFFTQYVNTFIEAHGMGDEFGKEVMKNAETG